MQTALVRKSTIFQLLGNLAAIFLSIAQGLILLPLYLSYLGADAYGRWLAVGGAVSMLAYIDLGITNVATQRTAAYFGAKKLCALGEFLGSLILWDVLACLLAGAIGLVLSPLVPQWFGVPAVELSSYTLAFQIATLDVVLMLLACMSASVLYGFQEPQTSIRAQLVGTALGLPLVYFFLKRGWGVAAIPLGFLARPAIMLPCNVYALERLLSRVMPSRSLRVRGEVLRELSVAALWLGPTQLFESSLGQLDNFIVVKFLGPTAVSSLDVTRKAAQFFLIFAGRISASLLSGLAHIHGEGDTLELRSTVRLLLRASICLALLGLPGIFLVNPFFVPLWTGTNLFGGSFLTLLCVCYVLFSILKRGLFNIVLALGEIRAGGKSSLVEFFVQCVAALLFVRWWGLLGIPIAGICAISCAILIQTAAYARHNPIYPTKVLKEFRMLSVAFIPAWIVGLGLRELLPMQSWTGLLVFTSLYGSVALCCLLARDSEFRTWVCVWAGRTRSEGVA